MAEIERDGLIEESVLTDLIQRAQESADPLAFDGLYMLYADRIFRYLLVRLGDAELAEEVASLVFLRLFEKLSKYRISPNDNVPIFSAWLYRLTHNKMIDVLRRQRRAKALPLEHAVNIAGEMDVANRAIDQVEYDQIIQKLSMLNEQQRQVIVLRFIEEMSIAETAKIMCKTEGAIKALQHRSLDNLRRFLET